LAFAGEGAVKATVQTERLEDINGVFDRMLAGQIEGRVFCRRRGLLPTRSALWRSAQIAYI
jgi:D-arabinose 1-dehydrogenase-like Zn-dependent alcohol dehydrogenase